MCCGENNIDLDVVKHQSRWVLSLTRQPVISARRTAESKAARGLDLQIPGEEDRLEPIGSGVGRRDPGCPSLRPGRMRRPSALGLRWGGIITDGVVGATADVVECRGSATLRAKVRRAKTTASSPWRSISRVCCSVSAGPRKNPGVTAVSVIVMAQKRESQDRFRPASSKARWLSPAVG